jgi:hypothetical protein
MLTQPELQAWGTVGKFSRAYPPKCFCAAASYARPASSSLPKEPKVTLFLSIPIRAIHFLLPLFQWTPLNRLLVARFCFCWFCAFCDLVATRRFERRLSSPFPFLWSTSKPSSSSPSSSPCIKTRTYRTAYLVFLLRNTCHWYSPILSQSSASTKATFPGERGIATTPAWG